MEGAIVVVVCAVKCGDEAKVAGQRAKQGFTTHYSRYIAMTNDLILIISSWA